MQQAWGFSPPPRDTSGSSLQSTAFDDSKTYKQPTTRNRLHSIKQKSSLPPGTQRKKKPTNTRLQLPNESAVLRKTQRGGSQVNLGWSPVGCVLDSYLGISWPAISHACKTEYPFGTVTGFPSTRTSMVSWLGAALALVLVRERAFPSPPDSRRFFCSKREHRPWPKRRASISRPLLETTGGRIWITKPYGLAFCNKLHTCLTMTNRKRISEPFDLSTLELIRLCVCNCLVDLLNFVN